MLVADDERLVDKTVRNGRRLYTAIGWSHGGPGAGEVHPRGKDVGVAVDIHGGMAVIKPVFDTAVVFVRGFNRSQRRPGGVLGHTRVG